MTAGIALAPGKSFTISGHLLLVEGHEIASALAPFQINAEDDPNLR